MKGSRWHWRIVALVIAILLTTWAQAQIGTWHFKAHMITARSQFSCATGNDGKIYVFGGYVNAAGGSIAPTGLSEVYDPATDTWSAIASIPATMTDASAVTAPDGQIYIIGGIGNGFFHDIVYAYDPAINSYTLKAFLPVDVFESSATVGSDGNIYVIGASGVLEYNIGANSWTNIGSPPAGLGLFNGWATDPSTGLLYMAGGAFNIPVTNHTFSFDAHANAFSQVADMGTGRSSPAAAFGKDGRLYAAGGATTGRTDSLKVTEAYDPATNGWSSMPDLHVDRAFASGAHDAAGNVYAIGGEQYSQNQFLGLVSSVECLTPPQLSGTGLNINGVEGGSFSGDVANFKDLDTSQTDIAFTASINWGDGTAPTTGAIAGDGAPGHFKVSGSHTYAEEGTYTTTITINDGDGESVAAGGKAFISDAPIHGTPQDFTAFANVQFTGAVGVLTDDNPQGKSSDFNAGLSWGDATPFDALTLVTNGAGGFNLRGTHTYLVPGTYTAHVEIFDVGQFIAFDVIATVTPAPPVVAGHDFSGTEGNKYTGQVAHFTDADPSLLAGNFTAAINWGDGSSNTNGSVVSDGAGGFNVNGSHTYMDEGDYTVQVSVTVTGGPSGSGDAEATIADAPLSASGFNLTCKGTNFSDTVAAFTDGNPFAAASEFSAAIFWGDGKSTTGTVIKAGSGFKVTGKHSYLKKGKYTVTITIRDGGGSIASATTHINAGPVK